MVIPIVIDLKRQLGSALLRVVVDAYFSKVPFLAPLVAEGIQVITPMRKDAVAWDERIENEPKKSVKLEGKWKLAHLLQEVSPQKIWVKIYSKQALVEA